MALSQTEGWTCSGDQVTLARRVVALTCTLCTPGKAFNASSMVKAQAAQCMPSTTT
jgi:hypothetical protein